MSWPLPQLWKHICGAEVLMCALFFGFFRSGHSIKRGLQYMGIYTNCKRQVFVYAPLP